MPNWVSQVVTITGSAEDVAKVMEQVSQPFTNKWVDKEYNQETQKWDIINLKEKVEVPVFSFWNIVKPADELLDTYYGLVSDKPDTEGLSVSDKITLEMEVSNGWYSWNCRNWGSKWDACDVDVLYKEPTTVAYNYNTAWSPSLPAIEQLSLQHPELTIHIEYEEEQGWGGEVAFLNGLVTYKNEYDIPTSHAEVEERGNECVCYGYEEKVFADCPE
jgi:hypothetical protein